MLYNVMCTCLQFPIQYIVKSIGIIITIIDAPPCPLNNFRLIYTARKIWVHKSFMACSLNSKVSNQFPSLGNELSVQAWTLRKLMHLWLLVHCSWVHFPSLETAWPWKLQVNKECNTWIVHCSRSCSVRLQSWRQFNIDDLIASCARVCVWGGGGRAIELYSAP